MDPDHHGTRPVVGGGCPDIQIEAVLAIVIIGAQKSPRGEKRLRCLLRGGTEVGCFPRAGPDGHRFGGAKTTWTNGWRGERNAPEDETAFLHFPLERSRGGMHENTSHRFFSGA